MYPRIAANPVVFLALTACAGGPGAAGSGGAGGGATTGAGGGGAAPTGCVDIRLDSSIVPAPFGAGPFDWQRHAFWIDDGGIHAVSFAPDPNRNALGVIHPFVFRTSFSMTGDVLTQTQYDPLPAFVDTSAALKDVAGAPDGSFAALLHFADDAAPLTVRDVIFFSSLDAPDSWTAWPAPWSDFAEGVHVAWDGDAFAMHANGVYDTHYYLTRARWTAGAVEVVTPTIPVGEIGAIYIDQSDFETDPVTGNSWAFDGTYLNAHDRVGNLLPGAQATGWGKVQPAHFGGSYATLAPYGQGARLAWDGDSNVGVSVAVDNAFATVGPDATLPGLRYAALAFLGDEPNLVAVTDYNPGAGFERFIIHADGSWSKSTVVRFANVPSPDLRNVSIVVWDGELWIGLHDESGGESPYRILRVHGDCTYPTMYEVDRQK